MGWTLFFQLLVLIPVTLIGVAMIVFFWRQ